MRSRLVIVAAVVSAVMTMLVVAAVPAQDSSLSPMEQLGKALFFDENLSLNGNQSCATCHAPEAGWTGPKTEFNAAGSVYEGSVSGAFGDRKPPSAAYATQSPILSVDRKGLFVGGNFWDGRATGEKLGNPAADQAQGPFLNPKEQALSGPDEVMALVCLADYADLFEAVWHMDPCDTTKTDAAYDAVGLAIAAYEASAEVNAFSSKFDYGTRSMAKLTQQEQRGHALFMGKGKCAKCHIANGQRPLFTDFTFDNLGIPKNPDNPATVADPDFADPGLGGFLAHRSDYDDYAEENMGKHKVPTLRNVDLRTPGLVKAYGHNGYFKSLEGIVHFYNTRDVKPVCSSNHTEASAISQDCWPPPEVPENVNSAELGNLGLSVEEEAAIVAFLKTLSDGYVPGKGK
jgi:cytochrome c peroxidase